MSLPAWYYRVTRIADREGREVEDYDFDEDLSSLGDDEMARDEDEMGKDKDEDGDKYEKKDEDEDEDDDFESEYADSENSYHGEDADHYYGLKEMRRQRKLWKLEDVKMFNEYVEEDIAGEKEFDAAYQTLLEAGRLSKLRPIGPIHGRWYLYCADAWKYLWHEGPAKSMKTLELDIQIDDDGEQDPEAGTAPFIYLSSNNTWTGKPFRTPRYASPNRHTLKPYDALPGHHDITVQFLGNGYLKLWVPWEIVCVPDSVSDEVGPRPPDAPEVFEFAGVREDLYTQGNGN